MKKLLIGAFALIVSNILAQEQGDLQVLFDNKDIKGGKGCFRIPSLVTAPNGNLIAVVDERIESCNDLYPNNDINIVMRRSLDGGKTWNKMETVVDFPWGQSASDASMVVNEKTKEIFMFYNYMDLSKGREYRLHFVKSADNGATWSKPTDITESIAPEGSKKDFKFITSGRQYYTNDGRIVGTLVNIQRGVTVFQSADNGASWSTFSEPLKPADESTITGLKDGRILVNSRVNRYGSRRIYTLGYDGKIQDAHDNITDPGCNASLLRTKGDTYFFTNLNDDKKRRNLSIRYSKTLMKSWSEPITIYGGSAAYSSLTSINRKTLGVLFEKDEYTQIAFKPLNLKTILKKK